MLVAAAAKQWNVPATEITIEKGVVKHAAGQTATFGELAGLRAAARAAGPFKLKDPNALALIGNERSALDTRAEDQRHGDVHHRRASCRTC